jgi:hypothetical protein
MYDSVILSGDALRSLEHAWCEYARRSRGLIKHSSNPQLAKYILVGLELPPFQRSSLLHVAAVVRPLRVAAETARAAARAGVLNEPAHAGDFKLKSARKSASEPQARLKLMLAEGRATVKGFQIIDTRALTLRLTRTAVHHCQRKVRVHVTALPLWQSLRLSPGSLFATTCA